MAAKKAHRTPSYGAVRLARIALELQSRPFGWAFDDIERTLGISERTLLRYVATSKKHLVDRWGQPFFQVVVQAGKRKLRLSETPAPIKPIAYQVASYL